MISKINQTNTTAQVAASAANAAQNNGVLKIVKTQIINPTRQNTAEQKATAAEMAKETLAETQKTALTEQLQKPKTPTLQELKDKSISLFHLQAKHSELTNKRRELDEFAITGDRDNAKVVITDVKGKTFQSSSPKTVGKIIEFWKDEFNAAIAETEEQIKKTWNIYELFSELQKVS
ncbi:MAG: hypothetical protein LBB53_01260 [Prevotellaceae bacterium]|jgi:hypothetical protein|nr:hypothetical protein [Prevotellaceae bacterium]